MTKENAHLYLPLVQALAEGKMIQENNYTTVPPARYDWIDLPEPVFNRQPKSYRIKPEPPKPREFWGNVHGNGNFYFYTTEEAAKTSRAKEAIETIHVREVIE